MGDFRKVRVFFSKDKEVININVDKAERGMSPKKAWIKICTLKSLGLQKLCKAGMPLSWRLFQAIKSFPQKTALSFGQSNSFRDFHINCLEKLTIEESSFDIKLVVKPFSRDSQCQEEMESFIMSDWSKELIIVNSLNLRVPFSNKSSFVLGEMALCISFNLKDPAASNKFPIR